jgi:hypothetical protein
MVLKNRDSCRDEKIHSHDMTPKSFKPEQVLNIFDDSNNRKDYDSDHNLDNMELEDFEEKSYQNGDSSDTDCIDKTYSSDSENDDNEKQKLKYDEHNSKSKIVSKKISPSSSNDILSNITTNIISVTPKKKKTKK